MKLALPLLLAVLFVGAYASAEEGRMCTQQYAPVCGTQQVQCIAAPCYPVYRTYGNACMMGNEKGTYLHEGACTEEETGPYMPEPKPDLIVTHDNIEAAASAMQELATATVPTVSAWDSFWSKVLSWFSWVQVG